LESKSAALLAAVFVDFAKNKCNFLPTKTSLISYGGSNSSQCGALLGVFLLGQSPPLPYGSRRLWWEGLVKKMHERVTELWSVKVVNREVTSVGREGSTGKTPVQSCGKLLRN